MNNEQRIIALASTAEAATGLGLLALPALIVGLLLGVEPEGIALVISRVAGIALIALAMACWPEPAAGGSAKPYLAMLFYNAFVAIVLAMVGFGGEMGGILLWPVAILHFLLAALLAWAWSRVKTTRVSVG
jgi:hypothetical protein